MKAKGAHLGGIRSSRLLSDSPAFGAHGDVFSLLNDRGASEALTLGTTRGGAQREARGSTSFSASINALTMPTNCRPSLSAIIWNHGQAQYSRRRELRCHRFLPVRQRRQNLDVDPTEPVRAEPHLDREIRCKPFHPLVSCVLLRRSHNVADVHLKILALSTKSKLAPFNLSPYLRTAP